MGVARDKGVDRERERDRESELKSLPDFCFLFLCRGALNLNLDGIFLDSNELHAVNIWLSDGESTRVLTATSSSAFRWLT